MNKVEVVGHADIEIGLTWTDATYDNDEQYIIIDTKKCISRAKKNNINYYEYVARCVNHEMIHHIFNVEHGVKTSNNLDNIAKRNKEYWMW